jgi:energy-coupling factor transport system permease protein
MILERRASPLHAARAAAGWAWCLALVCAAIMFEHPVVLGVLLATVLAGAAAARVLRRLSRMALYALPFALLIALINPIVVRDGLTVIWRFGEVPPLGQVDITLEAIAYGGILGLRAYVVLLASVLGSLAIDPDGVLRLFRRVSFRSALTAALAVRLVPVLTRDARRLAEARRCRADGGGSGRRAQVAVLRAVAAGALDRATDVAATLEVRGYGSARRPPRMPEPWSRHDIAFLTSAAALVALAILARVTGTAQLEHQQLLRVPLGAAEVWLCAALAAVALLPFADRRGIVR